MGVICICKDKLIDYLYINDTRYDTMDILNVVDTSYYTVSLNAKDKCWYLIEYKVHGQDKIGVLNESLCSSLSRINYMSNIVSVRKLDKTFSDCKEPSVDIYEDKVIIRYSGSLEDIIYIA